MEGSELGFAEAGAGAAGADGVGLDAASRDVHAISTSDEARSARMIDLDH